MESSRVDTLPGSKLFSQQRLHFSNRICLSRQTAVAPIILIAEAIAIISASAVTVSLQHGTGWSVLELPLFLCLMSWIALGLRRGLYRWTGLRLALYDIPLIVSTTLQGGGFVLAILVVLGAKGSELSLLGTFVLLGASGRIMTRVSAQFFIRFLDAYAPSRTLIIGSGYVAQRVAANLIKHKELGSTVIGFVDNHQHRKGTQRILALPLYPNIELERVIEQQRVDHVIFAFSLLHDDERLALLRTCQRYAHLQVSVVPRLFEAMPTRTRILDVRGIPLMQFETGGRSIEMANKRIFDVVAACMGLILGSPLLALSALAIRVEGRGPILFKQTRVGRDGKPFTMYKLRSMRERQQDEDANATSRHTKVGRILRKSSIDELPQLWNVLRGDMSLVGPRPEREDYVQLLDQRIPRYQERHRMRGGITGLSQVSRLRGDTSLIERTHLDNFYIDSWSLWLDLKIILLTFAALVPTSQGIGGVSMLQDIVSEVSQRVATQEGRNEMTHDGQEKRHIGTVATRNNAAVR